MSFVASAQLTLSGLSMWPQGPFGDSLAYPSWYGSASCDGGGSVAWKATEYGHVYAPIPPYYLISKSVNVYLSCTAGTTTVDDLIGTANWYIANNPRWHDISIPTSYAASFTSDASTLYAYKQQLPVSELPVALNYRCHPLHSSTVRAWGSDTNGFSVDTEMGAASDTSAATTVVPSVSMSGGTPSKPVAWSGQTDRAPFTLTLNMGPVPYSGWSYTGRIAQWDSIQWDTCGRLGTVVCDCSGLSVSRNGLHFWGSGSSIYLDVVTPASIPAGGDSFSVTFPCPSGVSYLLKGYDWTVPYAVHYVIPDASGVGTSVVSAEYEADVIYTDRSSPDDASWGDDTARIYSVSINVDPSWAEANDEDTDPSSSRVVIRESGLADTGSAFQWTGLQMRRDATSEDIQAPELPLPSAWVASGGCSVAQAGAVTTVSVTGSSASIARTLLDSWYLDYTTLAGLGSYGMPEGYQTYQRLAGRDVCCVDNYKAWKMTYVSDQAFTLTLTVGYNLPEPEENYLTDSSRPPSFDAGGSAASFSVDIPIAAAASPATVVFDLQVPAERDLRNLTILTLSGFPSGTYEWALHALVPVPLNPTTGEQTGLVTVKIVAPRPDPDTGKPISYEWFTATCDGLPAIRVPNQYNALCGEQGLPGLKHLVGAVSGEDFDAEWELSYWFGRLHRHQGITVNYDPTDSPNVWEPGHATFDAAFTDAAGNSMLGVLRVGDMLPAYDLVVTTSDSSYTTLPCGLGVGVQYLIAGDYVPCHTLDHRHGNLHGLMRTSSGARAGAGIGAGLWELDGSYTLVATGETDQYSRWSFNAGGRENHNLQAATGTAAPTTGSTKTYNELRAWLGLTYTPPSTCPRVALTEDAPDGQRWRAWATDATISVQRSVDGGRTWGEVVPVCSGTTPTLWRSADGQVWLGYIAGTGVEAEVRIRPVSQSGGSGTVVLSGMSCAGFAQSRGMAVAHVVAMNSTPDLVYARAYWVPSTGWVSDASLTSGIDTAVDAQAPSVAEEATGAVLVGYSKGGNYVMKRSTDGGVSWVTV